MRPRGSLRVGLVIAGLMCSAVFGIASTSFANEMCGDGTTFTLTLPGTSLGIDDTKGTFQKVDVPDVAREDHITIPNGCSIYAFFVSGFNQNAGLTDIPFYSVAEFVANHNGYVHVSWWNNLLRPYMERPLHQEHIVIKKLGGVGGTVEMDSTPGDGFGGFGPSNADLPKANPDEDYQFFSDASRVIREIRDKNPNALIVVAGHSMGGGAVVRLGLDKSVPIDLLAPIDPVGNRDKPEVEKFTDPKFNWTRWRVTRSFKGYQQYDCVRENGLCKDFDTRFFYKSYKCEPTGDWLDRKPLVASLAPAVCPRIEPYVDPGTQLRVGPNIRRFYHRWQHENIFPFDFDMNYLFLNTKGNAPLHQAEILKNSLTTHDPDKTCSIGNDPRDSSIACSVDDGHGEVLGYRGAHGKDRWALEMQNWPTTPLLRKTRFLELPTVLGQPWGYRPLKPELCMVCDDIIEQIQELLDEKSGPAPAPGDTTAPEALAVPSPDANAAGWNNSDVVVTISAEDEPAGSGVKEIEIDSNGATTIIPADEVTTTIHTEGTTSIAYLARDNAGNTSATKTLDLHIDKTPPSISADSNPPANANGWHNGNVTVSFVASDGQSGVESVSSPTVVTSEGVQDVSGVATDFADNLSSASVTISIDKTAPIVVATLSAPANANGWHNRDVLVTFTATDGLSGVQSVSSPVLVCVEGDNQSVTGTAVDHAGNVATTTVVIRLDKTPPEASVQFDPSQRRVSVDGHDELSGVPAGGVTPLAINRQSPAGQALHYRIEDRAGNALTVDTLETQASGNSSFSIASLNYGLGALTVRPNKTDAQWKTQQGALHLVEQFIETGQDSPSAKKKGPSGKDWANASYNEQRATTEIRSSSSPRHENRLGLALIHLTTSNGRLVIDLP